MWAVYLVYISLIRKDTKTNLILGLTLGLAVLNKMSALSLFLCYNILIMILSSNSARIVPTKQLPISYFRALLKYRHVFVSFAVTLFPYAIYRAIATEDDSAAIPYFHAWIRYVENIVDFNIIEYLKWFFVYLGQLNLSTGLFLLPLSTFMIISLCKSDDGRERTLGVVSVILITGVLALATLQSGYHTERLTERHFFITSPLVLILSLLWLGNQPQRVPQTARFCISVAIIIATGSALFVPSWSGWPAVDSAFIDSLKWVISLARRYGVDELMVKLTVLFLSSALILLSGVFGVRKMYVASVTVLALFMLLSVMATSYYQATKHLNKLRQGRFPVVQWVGESITYPANLVFMLVPRHLAIHHIIWNKDSYSRILWQAREHLENPSGFKFKDFRGLKRVIDDRHPTYFVSPFFTYDEASLVGHNYGLDIYKANHSSRVAIKEFHIDFGEPHTREVLKKGWSGNEGPFPTLRLPTFVWAVGRQSQLDVYTESAVLDKVLVFRATSYAPQQSVDIVFNEKDADTLEILPGWREYRLQIPSSHVRSGKNSLTFNFKHTKSPSDFGGRDTRKLAMAFDWLRLEDTT
jgi:hypothetical protein